MVQAFAGMMMMSGEDKGPPVRMGTQVLDHGTAHVGRDRRARGAAAPLEHRARRHGRHLAVRDRARLVDDFLRQLRDFGRSAAAPSDRQRQADRLPGLRDAQRPIVIAAANDRLFVKLAVALGREDWAKDPRFREAMPAAIEHREEILAEVARIVATRAKGEWIDILERAGVPCAPVNTLPEMLAEPQTEALGMLMQVPGLALRLMGCRSCWTAGVRRSGRRAPRLGEHNSELRRMRARRAGP
jgi:formyl-CoA transferase